MAIILPPIVFEEHLCALIECLNDGHSEGAITLDFANVRFYTPGAIAIVISTVHRWAAGGKQVFFANHENCRAFQYLQRLDFFKACNIDLPEAFSRHSPDGRFVPVTPIAPATDLSKLATKIARCVAPDFDLESPEESGPFDVLEYSISELASNVVQHSGARGFCVTQFTARSNLTRIAMSDFGQGVKGSFQRFGSPHYSEGMDDIGALRKALEPRVSCKTHMSSAWGEPINAGVGLTILKEIAVLVDGSFFIASGSGALSFEAGGPLRERTIGGGLGYCGTICAIAYNRDRMRNFSTVLHKAKETLGLLHKQDFRGLFQ